jgi:hypothetical protein
VKIEFGIGAERSDDVYSTECRNSAFSTLAIQRMFLKQISHMVALRRIRRVKQSPMVIGATGGSGTRVLHGVLEKAGLFMGDSAGTNHAGDAKDIEPMLDAFINPILSVAKSLDYEVESLPRGLTVDARRCLALCVDRFLHEITDNNMPWGWKNPRTMYILPLITELFPDLRFIHLVRDGRDMATSDNQNQPRKHYQAMFDATLDEDSGPSGSIRLWAAANLGTANWGERHLASRYLRIRFEDLCANPEIGITTLVEFAGLKNLARETIHEIAEEFVKPPASLGRWRGLEPDAVASLSRHGADALSRFGYTDLES